MFVDDAKLVVRIEHEDLSGAAVLDVLFLSLAHGAGTIGVELKVIAGYGTGVTDHDDFDHPCGRAKRTLGMKVLAVTTSGS